MTVTGLKKKKHNDRKCSQRCTFLRPLVDEALMKFLKKNKDVIFSQWCAKLVKEELIRTGHYIK